MSDGTRATAPPPPSQRSNRPYGANNAVEAAQRGLSAPGHPARTHRADAARSDGLPGAGRPSFARYILRIRLLIQIMEFSIAQLVW